MHAKPSPDEDEAALDRLFELAIDRLAANESIDLDAWLQERPHLRERAADLLALARDVSPGSAPATPGSAPRQLAGYTLIEEAGRGGMGIVFKARQESLGRIVALKILSPALVVSARGRRRFVVEAKALARLRHPNIVTVFEVVADDTCCAYAMEWVDGSTLAQGYAKRTQMEPRALARLGVQLASALDAVHAAGLVHRDVKPGNVLLRADGTPLLSDFGLARDDDHDLHTTTGDFLGTAAFASPEQLRGDGRRVGPRSDVYSLGVTLYVALTGSVPFGTTSNLETLRRIEHGTFTPIRRLVPGVPRDLATIVTTAMAADPDRRYASAAALAADLERFLANRPIHALPIGPWRRTARWIERNPWLAATILALACGATTSTVFAIDAHASAVDAGNQAIIARQHETAANRRAEENAQMAREKEALATAASAARADAERRAAELEQVLGFQEALWAEVDVAAMGRQLRTSLLARAEADQREDIDASVAGVNLSSVAIDLLREQVFRRSLAVIEKRLPGQPAVQARLQQGVARVAKNLGQLELAEAPQVEALATRRRILGDAHRDTLRSIGDLALLRQERGDHAAAEQLHREAVATWRREFGADDPGTIQAITLLASCLSDQHRFAEARELDEDSFARARRVLGDESEATLTLANNLGAVLANQARLQDAEKVLREALAIAQRTRGDEDRLTLDLTQNVANVLGQSGQRQAAVDLLVAVLATRRRVQGDDHPWTIGAIGLVGVELAHLKRYREAETLLREALYRSRTVHGPDHPDSLVAQCNLGTFLLKHAVAADGEALLHQGLASAQRQVGELNPITAQYLAVLGDHLLLKGDVGAAEPLARAALAGQRAAPFDETAVLVAVRRMGDVLLRQRKFADAEPLLRECWSGIRRLQGDDTLETVMAGVTFANALVQLERFREGAEVIAAVEPPARRVCAGPELTFTVATVLFVGGRAHLGLGTPEAFAVAESKLLEAHSLVANGPRQQVVGFAFALEQLYTTWCKSAPSPERERQRDEWKARRVALQAGK